MRARQRWGFSDWATGDLMALAAAARAGEPTSINGQQAAVATAVSSSMTECTVHLPEHVRQQSTLPDAATACSEKIIFRWSGDASKGVNESWAPVLVPVPSFRIG